MRIFLALAMAVLAAISATAADCDRACMKGLLTRYLDAIIAHHHAEGNTARLDP
jgi:hypothetical protein